MKLYRFSPIQDKSELMEAIRHIHYACMELCRSSFGEYLPNAGNIGIFCHYDDEYERLVEVRKRLTKPSEDPNQKYFELHEPIEIPATGDYPDTKYTHLYIRKPDPYRHHVGDVDFYLPPAEYTKTKQSLLDGKIIEGARIFPRGDLDMIELHNPDTDALAYVSTSIMSKSVRKKLSEETKL
jgi:hypothetical protein